MEKKVLHRGVHGLINLAHVQGRSTSIQEKKKEAGVLDVLSEVNATDVIAFLQAPAGSTGKTGELQTKEANTPHLSPPDAKSEEYAAKVFGSPSNQENISKADKKAAAWLSGSFATVCSIPFADNSVTL